MASPTVLPAFVDELQTVSVEVSDLGGVIARVVVKLWSRRMDLGRSCRHRCGMGLIHHRFGIGPETDMSGSGRRHSLSEPEEHPAMRTKSLEVRMAGRS